MNCTWPKHGGKTSVIAAVLEKKGLQTATAIDFSANINPIGTPTVMIEAMQKAIAENSMTYPDLTYQEHREKIARHEGVPKECVLLTNGGAEAIHLSAAWLRGKKVAIFQPSFSEYEQACQANGVDYDCLLYKEYFHFCSLPDNIEDIVRKYEAIYVCRPNNPSGTCLSFEELNRVMHVAKKYQTYILVDEAFIHFTADEQSAVSLCAEYDNLIIFRSLTKIFAVPGIRLGYMIADESVIADISSLQIPWSVNAVALSLIDCMPDCQDFINETVTYIEKEKQWLAENLDKLDFQMSKTCTNFYLLRDPFIKNHEELLIFLVEKGILARHTYNFMNIGGTALRFAIRTNEENEQLIQALRQWRNNGIQEESL